MSYYYDKNGNLVKKKKDEESQANYSYKNGKLVKTVQAEDTSYNDIAPTNRNPYTDYDTFLLKNTTATQRRGDLYASTLDSGSTPMLKVIKEYNGDIGAAYEGVVSTYQNAISEYERVKQEYDGMVKNDATYRRMNGLDGATKKADQEKQKAFLPTLQAAEKKMKDAEYWYNGILPIYEKAVADYQEQLRNSIPGTTIEEKKAYLEKQLKAGHITSGQNLGKTTFGKVTDVPTYITDKYFQQNYLIDRELAKETGEDTWFSEGAFKDGYDGAGDIAKSAGATVGDVGLSVLEGIGHMGEGLVDLATYGVAGLVDLFGGDETAKDIKAFAKQNHIEDAFGNTRRELGIYNNSLLGNKSRGVGEGIGQIGGMVLTGGLGSTAGLTSAGTTILTSGTMGLSSMGSGMSEAYSMGATDGEAFAYGLTTGAVETISELIFGGLGKGVKALGVSKGLTSIDDVLAKKISNTAARFITSDVGQRYVGNALEYAVKSGAEGLEEVLSGLGSAVAKDLFLLNGEDEKAYWDIVKDENLLEQFIVGSITSAIAQGGDYVKSTFPGKKGVQRDFVSGLSSNEQKVVDKVYERRLAEESENKTLSNKDKNKLYDRVVEEMKKGYISTDEIESILGGETYKGYKDLTDKKTSLEERKKAIESEIKSINDEIKEIIQTPELQFTVEQRETVTSLREKITSLREEAKGIKDELQNLGIKTAKNKLFNEVNKLTSKDTYLRESYNDLIRQTQDLQIDENQYNGTKFADAAKKTIENARKAGASNSNRVRDFVEFSAKYSSVSGKVVDFKKDADIKGMLENQLKAQIDTLSKSTTAEDKEKLAKLQDKLKQVREGKIKVNGVKTKDGVAININSSNYLNTVLGHEVTHFLESNKAYEALQKAAFKYAQTKGDYEGRREVLEVLYDGIDGTSVDYELTADLVGDYLFTEYDFIKSLSTENRNVFQYVFDQIKYMFKLATAGSKEQRELEKVMHNFEKALRESTEVSQNTQYSLSKDIENFDNSWYNEIDLPYAEQKRVQSEALTWHTENKGQPFSMPLSNGFTYLCSLDNDGIVHIYGKEKSVNIHEFGGNYDNRNTERPDRYVEKFGNQQGIDIGDNVFDENGQDQIAPIASNGTTVQGEGRSNGTGYSKNDTYAYRKPKAIGWHLNDDGSVEVTYSDGTKETEIAPIKKTSSSDKNKSAKAAVSGTKWSISGERSKTADTFNLAKAKTMLEQGVDSETIRQETNWFKSYDGKWRYEIDDSKAKWHLDTIEPIKNGFSAKRYKLGDLLEHEELYEAYPQLKDVAVWDTPMILHGEGHADIRSTDNIVVGKMENDSTTKQVILHELQHIIQNIEGFAQGSSVSMFDPKEWGDKEYDALKKRNAVANELYDILRKNGVRISDGAIYSAQNYSPGRRASDEIIDRHYSTLQNLAEQNNRIQALLDEYDKQVQILYPSTPEAQYFDTAGEIEAFDTMNRMELSAEERKATRPNIDNPNAIVLDVAEDGDSATRLSKNEVSSTDGGLFDEANTDIRYSLNDTNQKPIDKYTQKQYNDFGWARNAEAISKNELDDMYSKIQIKGSLSKFPKSTYGEAIIEVNDKAKTTLEANNVLVFVTGTKKAPQITRVVKFNLFEEDLLDGFREDIYANTSKRALEAYSYMLGEEIIRYYDRSNSESFGEYTNRTRSQRSGSEGEGIAPVDRNRNQRNGAFEQTQSNEIAPIKEVSSIDDAFFDGENSKYSLSWEGDNRTLGGSYRFSGKDLLKSEQDIAPVAVGVAENATTNKTVDDIAPVNGNNADIVKSKTLSYSEEETKSILKDSKNKIATSYNDVLSFISSVQKGKINGRLFLGKIKTAIANKIKSETQVSAYGKSIVLSSDDLKHIFKRHGNAQTEKLRGQEAITKENFSDILGTIFEPDSITQTTDSSGVNSLIFQKNSGGKITAVTMVSEKKKALTLKSAWITKKGQHISPPSDVQAPNLTPNSELSMDAIPTDSITENELNVNKNSEVFFDGDNLAPVAEDVKTANTADNIAPVVETKPRIRQADNKNTAPDGMGERSWYGTSTGSEAVDGIVTLDDIPDDVRYYQVKSNKKSLETANARLTRDGFEKSKEYFEGRMSDRKLTVEDIALGERLIQEAAKAGDAEAVRDLIIDVSILGTELGQQVQALSMIRRLTPEGQLKALIRTVERGKAKGDKAFEGVEVTDEMTNRILSVYKASDETVQKLQSEIAKMDGATLTQTDSFFVTGDTFKHKAKLKELGFKWDAEKKAWYLADASRTFDQAELDRAVEEVKQQIADQMPVGALDYINAWRYLSMLGNPKTHIRNVVSNVAMFGTRSVKNAIARTIEDIAPIKNRTKTWKPATKAVKDFSKQTTAEMEIAIKGDNKYSDESSIKAKRKIFKTAVGNALSDFNTNSMEAEDFLFSKQAFKATLQEYLTANGIKTEADIKNNPELVKKAKDYALDEARRATFRQDSFLANKISEIEKKNPLYGIAVGSIMPFKKTPINIAKTGAAYSPLGFARNVYDAVKVAKGEMDVSVAIDHLAQSITGTALTLIGYALAESGILNGAGDDDKEGKYDYQLGKQSYSFNYGGDTYSLSWLSPVAMPLFVGANAYETLVEKNEWNANVVIDTLGQTLDPLSEMSFLSSLDDVLSSYDSGIAKIWGAGESMVQNYVTQFVPTALSQVAATMDDTKRSTKVSGDSDFEFGEETLNKIKYKIPGLRNTLEPTTDIWGNEYKQTEDGFMRFLESFLSPANKRENISTAVDDELKALYREVGKSELLPAIPYDYINYKDVKYDMSATDYTEYKQTYGQTAYNLMRSLFDTNTYKNASSEDKAAMISDVYDYARDAAKNEYFTKYGVDYTNTTYEGNEVFKENPIKGAIEADLPVNEYSFSKEYPGRYKFFKANGISYNTYKEADEADKRAYTWAYENPGKYTLSKAISDDFLVYYQYKNKMNSFDAKDENGKTVSGLKKERVIDYINNLNIEYGQKIILYKSMFDSKEDRNKYNADIVDYLNSREDISYSEMQTILKELGFNVDSKGNITW